MEFYISFIPQDLKHNLSSVCIFIDVLRASSAIVSLFDKGCKEVLLTDREEKLVEIKNKNNSKLLICSENLLGERLDIADFSPSLIEINALGDLTDSTVAMKTTNGTVGIHKLMEQGFEHIFIGSMLNSKQVAEEAVSLAAKLGFGINIVCAGRNNGKTYTIDDIYCAAKIVQYAKAATRINNIEAKTTDSVIIAEKLLTSYLDIATAFEASASGNTMRRLNCHQDIALCARDNITKTVPKVAGINHEGFIVVKA